jgi:hypothetical protein
LLRRTAHQEKQDAGASTSPREKPRTVLQPNSLCSNKLRHREAEQTQAADVQDLAPGQTVAQTSARSAKREHVRSFDSLDNDCEAAAVKL